MVTVVDSQYWEQRYQEGKTGWDLGIAAPPFVSLLKSSDSPTPGRIAVLGCGRGYDALLFANYGFEVIGFDFASSAIDDANALLSNFKKTNSENYDLKTNINFLQRDIFELPQDFSGYFDYVLEHTCFCAIDPPTRLLYPQLIKSILKPQGQLIALFFTHNRPGGPPFGVTTDEIHSLFSPHFYISSLQPVANSISQRQGEEHLGIFRLIS
jgi:methyl halide transferase